MHLRVRIKRATPAAALVLVVAATAGCAPKSSSDPSSTAPRSQRLITAGEIQSAGVVSAYQAVARLRPLWLQRRAQLNMNPGEGVVVAYVDGVRVGSAEQLERIQASTVKEIEYLSGPDATTRFGRGHAGGAILVRTH